jgi:hypothetical protein
MRYQEHRTATTAVRGNRIKTMSGTRIFWILFLLFVFFFVITQPDDAASMGHSLGHGIQHAFNSLSEFVKKL